MCPALFCQKREIYQKSIKAGKRKSTVQATKNRHHAGTGKRKDKEESL